MEGPNLEDEEMGGIIPRSIRLIFELIQLTESSTVFTISVSYFEVYCERLRDLLNPSQDNMKIRESKETGYSIPDLFEVYITFTSIMLQVTTNLRHIIYSRSLALMFRYVVLNCNIIILA
jgi:hypothetical protein